MFFQQAFRAEQNILSGPGLVLKFSLLLKLVDSRFTVVAFNKNM